MAYNIPTASNFPTPSQVPDHAIVDINGKQAYLGNQFNLTIPAFSITGTAETNMALITNPAASKKSIFVRILKVSSVASYAQLKFYMNPTVTGVGVAATAVNARFAMTGNTSVSACSTAPTTSARGTLSQTLESALGNGGVMDSSSMMILDPGVTMLITCTPGATSLVNANIAWHEI